MTYLRVSRHFNLLGNVDVGGQVQRSDRDLVVRAEVVVGQGLYLLRPRRAPHEDLTIGADLRNDLPDLGFKAHVQHSEDARKHL
jgi:hypothetical protein